MSSDMNRKIEKLKEMAIGRCRERIEQAACRAKVLIDGSKPEDQMNKMAGSYQTYGMTSFLRKRHGL